MVFTNLICLATDNNRNDGVQHEKELERVLLGIELGPASKDPRKSNNSKAVLFGYLEDAIYLCIDQEGNKGQQWLDELNNDFKVEGLPKSIKEFSVPGGGRHEKYTHLGWDYQYYSNPEVWRIRQNILLATVSKVFGFPVDKTKTSNEKYTEQCIEMSKLIYYIHILGDHKRNSYETNTDRIQLGNAKITAGVYTKGLINELRSCIQKLTWSERTSNRYNLLMVKLNVLRFRAWITGEEDSENKHKTVSAIATDTLNQLCPHLRNLLLQIDFFKSVFA